MTTADALGSTEDYMNLTTDSALRRLLLDDAALRCFLCAILPVKIERIEAVTQMKPSTHADGSEEIKTDDNDPVDNVSAFTGMLLIRFVIVCVTSRDETVNVELQVAPDVHFLNRMAYYSARLVTEKQEWSSEVIRRSFKEESSEKSSPPTKRQKCSAVPWDYRLRSAYVITICDFTFGRIPDFPTSLRNHWMCWAGSYFDLERCETTFSTVKKSDGSRAEQQQQQKPTHVPFDNVANYCLISLPSFTIESDSLDCPSKRLLWLLCHLGRTSTPLPSWLAEEEGLGGIVRSVRYADLSDQDRYRYDAEVERRAALVNTRLLAGQEAAERSEERGRTRTLQELSALPDDEILELLANVRKKNSATPSNKRAGSPLKRVAQIPKLDSRSKTPSNSSAKRELSHAQLQPPLAHPPPAQQQQKHQKPVPQPPSPSALYELAPNPTYDPAQVLYDPATTLHEHPSTNPESSSLNHLKTPGNTPRCSVGNSCSDYHCSLWHDLSRKMRYPNGPPPTSSSSSSSSSSAKGGSTRPSTNFLTCRVTYPNQSR